jgi:phage/plasmid-associated DNA primase
MSENNNNNNNNNKKNEVVTNKKETEENLLLGIDEINEIDELIEYADKIQEKTTTKNPDYQNIVLHLKRRKSVKHMCYLTYRQLYKDYYLSLKKRTNELLILNKKNNTYQKITDTEFQEFVNNKVTETRGLLNNNDIETIISHISDYIEPDYNIIQFQNCLVNMETQEIINKPETPLLPYMFLDHNYCSHPFPTIWQFLTTSLKQKKGTESTEKYVHGVMELIGYLFTAGNHEQKIIFITGQGGSGKSIFGNLLTKIFKKVSNIRLESIDRSDFALAGIKGKYINITRDADSNMFRNSGLLKQVRGNEDIDINPKFEKPQTIIAKEVPKFIIMANNLPYMKPDTALTRTSIIIEFIHRFRGTKEENKEYGDGFPAKEIEGFIKACISEYWLKNKKDDFALVKTDQETDLTIMKHEQPLDYCISSIVEYVELDHDEETDDIIYVSDLSKKVMGLAEREGIQLPLSRKGDLSGRRVMSTIRRVFDLTENYNTKHFMNQRYYPNLEWKK